MKLASLIVVALLGGVAHADDDAFPLDPYENDPAPQVAPTPFERATPAPVDPFGGPRHRMMKRQRQPSEMRELLMRRFDANHDGRLQPQERQRAARALRKLAMKLDRGAAGRREKIIRRFDRDHDGHVGPGELPPRAQKRLRRFDRDGDGWVERGEMR